MSRKKNKNEEVKIEFLGNSAVDVTGSCVQATFLGKTYLFECGMVQGYTVEKNFTLNSELINKIKVDNLEAIFYMHSHCDHTALIPAIIRKQGFHGRLFTTYETKEISRKLLEDSAYINNKDVEYLSKRKGGKVAPLYKDTDVVKTYELTEACELNKLYEINENVSFKLIGNNHCLGSSQLVIYFKTPSNKVKKICYTSDLGSARLNNKPFIKPIDYCKSCNLFIIESTYGKAERGYTKQDVVNERKDIKKTILEVTNNRGNVLLPCFSFSRTQEILVELYRMFGNDDNFHIPIIVDSKLSVEISQIYIKVLQGEDFELMKKVSEWKNVKFNKDIKGTLMNLADDEPKIICSSQGFVECGRSNLYAQHFLPNKKDAILFVGYAPENSVGGRIINQNTKSVKIGTKTFPKRCLIKTYKTFSSHAQQDDIIKYLKMINTDRVIIHHGNKEAKKELIEVTQEELKKIGKTTKLIPCNKGMEIVL